MQNFTHPTFLYYPHQSVYSHLFFQLKDQYWSLLYTLEGRCNQSLSLSCFISVQCLFRTSTWERLLKALLCKTSRWCPKAAFLPLWWRCTIWVTNLHLSIISHPTGMNLLVPIILRAHDSQNDQMNLKWYFKFFIIAYFWQMFKAEVSSYYVQQYSKALLPRQ